MKIVTDILWRIVAFVITRPLVREYLIGRAQLNPYHDIWSRDGKSIYMRRGWVANAYQKDAAGNQLPARRKWLPSVRVHHICRPDADAHLHSHPWPARTIILDGWYAEVLMGGVVRVRKRGDTGSLSIGEFHRIASISDGGVWTLFFTWGESQGWGFRVDGKTVPWREYLGVKG